MVIELDDFFLLLRKAEMHAWSFPSGLKPGGRRADAGRAGVHEADATCALSWSAAGDSPRGERRPNQKAKKQKGPKPSTLYPKP